MLFNLLMGAVMLLAAYTPMVGETTQAWFGIVAAAITMFLNTTYTASGKWISSGWTWLQWIVVVAQMALQMGNLITDEHLIPAHIVNFVMVAATFAIQYFGKVYKVDDIIDNK